ncbi:hypothetical protein VTJ49DRAFT_2258 [Mycothermus thermophilus]|uniref:Uncharacterized protein n=1 Tax=Humicola insolens TaxID=85995 RepID=A0ABR3VBF3_HUMIN
MLFPGMDSMASPVSVPPAGDVLGTSSTRDFAAPPRVAYTPGGASTPSSTRTNMPLLPTTNPVSPVMYHDEKNSLHSKWRRFLTRLNEIMLGKDEKASVYWYASLLSVLAALIVTGSSIFGWPPLPIWDFPPYISQNVDVVVGLAKNRSRLLLRRRLLPRRRRPPLL